MPLLHTPECRTNFFTIEQANPAGTGVITDRFVPNFPLVAYINVTINQNIWFTAGYVTLKFDVLQGGDLIYRRSWTGWTATDLPGRPATNFWLNFSFFRATDFTDGQRRGIFLFKPSIYFEMWGPGASYIPDELL
jgi:hypothetical protein